MIYMKDAGKPPFIEGAAHSKKLYVGLQETAGLSIPSMTEYKA